MNVLRVVTALGAGVVGVVGFRALVGSKPQAKRKPVERLGALVEVLEVQPTPHQLAVRARGLVKPARVVSMTPQVSGVVEDLHPQLIEGGHIPADAVLVRIDDTDYRLQVAQARAQLEQARQSLEVEKARQAVAIREWKLMGSKAKNKARATRVPQIKMAEASVSAARNAVQQAGVNRKRTTLKAPFNAMVRTETVELGQLIGPQSRIADLVGTDAFWIEVLVPLRELPLIQLPEGDTPGSAVKVSVVNAGERTIERDGRVVRLLGELDAKSRMAKVIVEVKDPLGLASKSPRLLLNSFVKVAIEGPKRDDLTPIPRIALREGDVVWLLTDDHTLKVTPVDVVRRLNDKVLVKGLKPGTPIIKSRLASPVPGMALRLAGAEPKVAAKAAPKSAP